MPLVDTANVMVWNALKPYLPPGTRLTSVYRPASEQLAFIVRKAKKEGYVFDTPPVLRDRDSWIGALEFLRARDYKIAEPNKSMHQRGIAYDLAGPDLGRIEKAVHRAVADRRIVLSKSKHPILRELKNHCVHVEIEAAVIDNEAFDFT